MEKDDFKDTNMGWWTDRPDRVERASSFTPISGPYKPRRSESVWLKIVLIVGVMLALGFAVAHLASAG